MRAVQTDLRRDRVGGRNETWFLAALVLAMPLTSSLSQSAGQHPDRRFVDQSIPVTTTVRLSGPRSETPLAFSKSATTSIGREDGPEELMFGEITSAAGNSRGQIVIVDKKTEDVRLFDAQGKFLQRLGRKGQGPGEFRAPHSVLVTPSDEIWVSDLQRRLTVFVRGTEGYRLARTIPVDIGIRSMCHLGGNLVVNGMAIGDPQVIRILDPQAGLLRAFGRLYASPNEMLNLQFAEGKVACDAANQLIVYASSAAIGEVRAYQPDGRALWRVVIEGVKTSIVTDGGGGAYSVRIPPEGVHSLVSLNIVPQVGIVVQYSHRTAAQIDAKEPVTDIQTIIIDPRTGAASLSAAAWPRLGAVSGNRAIVFFEDPAPRLEIRELRRP